mgnify:FL=1
MGDECEGGVMMCCRGVWKGTCDQDHLGNVGVKVFYCLYGFLNLRI